MNIDRRVRAKEFMGLLAVGRTKFYTLLKKGHIPEPVRITEKDVFWYESVVKKEVEKFKYRRE
ncbi:transcriptional regulator [Acinetobacter junii]|uniref:helix-turn-helix transcriptional regulator n=1 Tax=Acinetobacter TaxID=469 RepID=UPI000C1B51F6|nr:AlpA family phage regulatory protein [Acinetobacter junii]ATU44169.1 transcriptional regulator [Acinetobacter junii]HAV3702155.1 AlpA family phage regulatory protein [Acinetobacter baumannii]